MKKPLTGVFLTVAQETKEISPQFCKLCGNNLIPMQGIDLLLPQMLGWIQVVPE